MIKFECDTKDAGVLSIISKMFAALAELAGKATEALNALAEVTPAIVEEVVGEELKSVIEEPPANETEQAGLSDDEIKNIAASVPAPDVELDSTGLPWDDRINVKSKTKRQSDQTWKLTPRLAPTYVEEVKAELRVLMASVATEATEKQVETPPGAEATAAAATETTEEVVETPPDTANATADAPTTFAGLLQAFTARQAEEKITAEEMDALCVGHGAASVALLASRPDLIPLVYADMEAVCSTRS